MLASIDNKKDQDDFLEALSSIRIRAQVKFVDSCAQIKEFFSTPAHEREANLKPSLILLVTELSEDSSMTLIKDLKSIEEIKKIPLIVVSKRHDEYQLKKAYLLGVTSVIKYPTHFESIVKILQIMDEYWFNTVKLPFTRR